MRRPYRCLAVLVLILCWLPLAALAQQLLELEGPDRLALLAEDAEELQTGVPLRFALPADVALTPAPAMGWDRLPDGRHRWRLRVSAPGSLSLNFGFRTFRLPWGGRLEITSADGPDRTFTAADNRPDGELWTPVVLGDTALLTLLLPDGHRDDFELELQHVGRGYRFFGEKRAQNTPGWCNIDVVCPEGDDWRSQIRSVGVYSFGGSRVCTGSMLNNTAQDGTPYFLTASHCGVSTSTAASVVVYWNFESPECGQLAGENLDDFQTGAVWRAGYTTSDMTLIELSAPPDTSWHVTYAGWDRSGAPVSAAVGVHHPRGSVKCISFENDPLQVTSYLGVESPGDGTHWRVVDWDLGTTEPGSSGSPLYDPAGRVIGKLHGGYAACGNDLSDWYGRLSVSWLGGGTPESQLSPWLDPLDLGVLTIDLLDPLQPEPPPIDPEPDPQARLVFWPVHPNPNLDGPVSFQFTLARGGSVRLGLYDLRGRLVDLVVDADLPAGHHVVSDWQPGRVASGVYLFRLEALGRSISRHWTRLR